jgi:tRNA uridine 5-carboxymethylaminomethyl modification enzyme
LIDDLVNKGVDEPYRMFTSRAEYRILLRQDNADFRLTEKSYELGLASEERYSLLKRKKEHFETFCKYLNQTSISPTEANSMLKSKMTAELKQKEKLSKVLLRPQVKLEDLIECSEELKSKATDLGELREELIDSVEINIKYENYIEREKLSAEKLKRLEYVKIPDDFDFGKLQSLSTEAGQKLSKIQPKNIGQALRIPGVSPADINALLVYFGR